MNWIELAQDRGRWWGLVTAAMILRVSCGEFLDLLRTGRLLKKDCAAWSN